MSITVARHSWESRLPLVPFLTVVRLGHGFIQGVYFLCWHDSTFLALCLEIAASLGFFDLSSEDASRLMTSSAPSLK